MRLRNLFRLVTGSGDSYRRDSRYRAGCVFFATFFCAVGPVGIASAQPVMIDASACIGIESVLERLDCFDSAVRRELDGPQAAETRQNRGDSGAAAAGAGAESAASGRPDGAGSAAERADSATAAEAGAIAGSQTGQPDSVDTAASEAGFGLPREPVETRDDEPEELESEVAALREIQPGRLEITLTNGQVWRQTNSDRYRLQPGHAVRIYPTRFGRYYRLTAPALRGFVQVERIR